MVALFAATIARTSLEAFDFKMNGPSPLAALNPAQRAAVTFPASPVLLACGPGSGKTLILTHRIQWLIEQEGLPAAAILAMTFSRAAADELLRRIRVALGQKAEGVWAGTFHAFGAWLLRRHAAAIGRTPAFTILDREDTRRLVGRLKEELNLGADATTLVEALERAKQARGVPAEDRPVRLGAAVARLLPAYEARCREANALDFTDLLTEPLALFERQPRILAAVRARFRAVLVDEAQDLCALQHGLVEALTARAGAVTFAGDDDQAIFAWRGGDVARLRGFERTYADGAVLAVGQNYRSTPEIVATAARLIAHNLARRPKPLTAVPPSGPEPSLVTWPDDHAEAQGLAAQIAAWMPTTTPPVTILARVTACLGPIARACEARGLTVRVLSERPLAERAAVRDVLAVCRVLVNPADWAAWERVVRVCPCGIGVKTLDALRTQIPLMGVAAVLADAARRRPRLAALLCQLEAWRACVRPVSPLLKAIVAAGPAPAPSRRGVTDEEQQRRAEDIEMLFALARQRDAESGGDLGEFLDTLVLSEDGAPGVARTQVLGLTLHAAKGLEFDTVVMLGVEDGLLPHYRRWTPEALAEERRLCYVGMTRAKRRLVVSVCAARRLWGQVWMRPPSRFLVEAGLMAASRPDATASRL